MLLLAIDILAGIYCRVCSKDYLTGFILVVDFRQHFSTKRAEAFASALEYLVSGIAYMP
jgi:hypothetical protein